MLTIVDFKFEARDVAIAEGDVLELSIRESLVGTKYSTLMFLISGLASELLIGRYKMPKSRYPDCLLARHEAGFFAQCQSKMAEIGNHRGDAFNRLLLPLCQPLVQAIGHRMAYEAAIDAQLDQYQLDLYEAHAMKFNSAWYSENVGIGWWQQHEREEKAATAAIPFVQRDVDAIDVEPFAVAPILSDEKWRAFVQELQCFPPGNEELDLFSPPEPIQTAYGSLVRLYISLLSCICLIHYVVF